MHRIIRAQCNLNEGKDLVICAHSFIHRSHLCVRTYKQFPAHTAEWALRITNCLNDDILNRRKSEAYGIKIPLTNELTNEFI